MIFGKVFEKKTTVVKLGFAYWLCPKSQWPGEFWELVEPEKVLGCCPGCGGIDYFSVFRPKGEFPKTYSCGRCGFNGAHPLHGVQC